MNDRPYYADDADDTAGEPGELRDLPREVRRLVHAADCMRSDWAESSKPRRAELWRDLHQAVDDVWNRQIDGDQARRTAAEEAPR